MRHGEPVLQGLGSRADKVAQKFVALAETGSVLLMGRGLMKRLIGDTLSTRGWIGASTTDNEYWSHKSYIHTSHLHASKRNERLYAK